MTAAPAIWSDPDAPWPPAVEPRCVLTSEDLERIAAKGYGEHESYPSKIELPRCRCGLVAASCPLPWPGHVLPLDDSPARPIEPPRALPWRPAAPAVAEPQSKTAPVPLPATPAPPAVPAVFTLTAGAPTPKRGRKR